MLVDGRYVVQEHRIGPGDEDVILHETLRRALARRSERFRKPVVKEIADQSLARRLTRRYVHDVQIHDGDVRIACIRDVQLVGWILWTEVLMPLGRGNEGGNGWTTARLDGSDDLLF